jgi:hypothetical protein
MIIWIIVILIIYVKANIIYSIFLGILKGFLSFTVD